ncbi:MAG TPA: FAD-binding and (Fe-S)-binding domain-containing protein [Gaiellaceae bacterium]
MKATVQVPAHPDPRFRTRPVATDEVDVRSLVAELERTVEGEVRFTDGDRALYAATGSNYRQLPIGVVVPRTTDGVVATVASCRAHGAPLVSRGGGTSLAGQSVNVAVVVDFSKYLHEIVSIDPAAKLARIQPGLVLDDLRDRAVRDHGLTYGPDPSTHTHCTLGGMIGNNSCGTHSVMAQFYGPGPRTEHQVEELDVVLYDGTRLRVGTAEEDEIDRIVAEGGRRGEIYARLRDLRDRHSDEIRRRYPDIPRRVSGYNLDQLLPENGFNVAAALVGTESTCATILEATVRLVENPRCRSLLVVGYEDAYEAGDHVPQILEHRPIGLEGVDDVLIEDMTVTGIHKEDLSMLPDGKGWLLVELGGETKEESDAKAHAVMEELRKDGHPASGMKLYDDPEQEAHIWEVREAGLGATAFIPGKPDAYEGWEDSAVPPERVGDYLRDLRKLAGKFGYESALYGHYGQGCIHARWNFDLVTREGIDAYRRFTDEAADLVLSYGGSLSGEHGDGQSRAELLPKMFGDELVEAFREFKTIWDPDWKLNPGKVVDAYRRDDNLRLGTSFHPLPVKTHFAYPRDGGFAHATTRCVGIGNCRRTNREGVMCPSYVATREEKHSTRGRARLLWEMLNGEEIELWRDDAVFDALDLCLSCKGCTNDCPVNVDMPTLKSEFLSHYWSGRLRPRHAYAFGLIDQAARVASRAPRLVNALSSTPPFSAAFKLAAGIARERDVPRFAPRTLRDWLDAREPANPGGPKVILWADTFNNYFHAGVGVAAVEALEAAGYRVEVPQVHLCCGRPLYDYGFLGLARSYLERVVETLRDDIRAGVPVVGVEPSCLAVFKDELPRMLPEDEDAKRLARQSRHFAEFLREQEVELPRLERKAIVWGHCHHHATGGLEPEHEVLDSMGVEVEQVTGGCCGLAGSFGFEAGHHDVSMACGEHALLPAVRAAAGNTLVVADGFSCKTQIEQAGTGRRGLHLAEVIAIARRYGPEGPPGELPERHAPEVPARAGGGRGRLAAGALLAAALAGLAAWRLAGR